MYALSWSSLGAAIIGLAWAHAEPPYRSDTCLTVGVGIWTPEFTGAIWPRSRSMRLLDKQEPYYRPDGSLSNQWRVAELEPLSGKKATPFHDPEYERAWVWTSPTPDSLVILRPAILSEGVEFVGAWTADTLRGRAYAFSDAIDLDRASPRANAYAVRYSCLDAQAALQASAAVEALRSSDVPDSALGAREDSARVAELRAQFRH